jgi:hypothetical protein
MQVFSSRTSNWTSRKTSIDGDALVLFVSYETGKAPQGDLIHRGRRGIDEDERINSLREFDKLRAGNAAAPFLGGDARGGGE